jgi:hypothetical protein
MYVVGDAYSMPWVPYAGQQHMEHSFLLVATRQDTMVIDAYHNNTEWGDCRPGVWRVPSAALDGTARAGAVVVIFTADPLPRPDPAAVLAANAAALDAARPEMERYLAALRACQDGALALNQLVLDVWLLGRARALHAAWLASLPTRAVEAAIAGQNAHHDTAAAMAAAATAAQRDGVRLPCSRASRQRPALAGPGIRHIPFRRVARRMADRRRRGAAFLAQQVADQGAAAARYLDDLWNAARHRSFRYRWLAERPDVPESQRELCAAAGAAWARLPAELRIAVDSAARGRPRVALLTASVEHLLKAEDACGSPTIAE